MFEAMGLDPARVTPDMILKTMQQDSQANSSISRKALDDREQGRAMAEAGLRKQAQDGAGGGHDYDECMSAVKQDIEFVVKAFAVSRDGVAQGVGLSAPLLADSASSNI